MSRELVILGTASQAPTRERNHNGYLLRWDAEGVLFDPGEGTQRQLLLAGVPVSAVTRICLTHFHGDHCLGLPGVLQRRSLDRITAPVDAYYPASGEEFLDRLRFATAHHDRAGELRRHPVAANGPVGGWPGGLTLHARRLDHPVETYGWRLEEPDGHRMLPEALAEAGVRGPDIGRLRREGSVTVAGRTVHLEEVSTPRRGQAFAFVMDTGRCPAALELARGADLLVCESTFLAADADLAASYRHLTARQAAELAREAGARRLVLTHFSQRYPDPAAYLAEAAAVFPDVVLARDLDRVSLPPRPSTPV